LNRVSKSSWRENEKPHDALEAKKGGGDMTTRNERGGTASLWGQKAKELAYSFFICSSVIPSQKRGTAQN
jgi:hypothetical protein